MRKKALKREDRLRQIMLAFAVKMKAVDDDEAVEMTVAEIARHLQLAPSTKLREMIVELVIDGQLDYRKEDIPGVCKYRVLYSPNPKKFTRPKPHYRRQGRAIKINSKQGSFFAKVKDDSQ